MRYRNGLIVAICLLVLMLSSFTCCYVPDPEIGAVVLVNESTQALIVRHVISKGYLKQDKLVNDTIATGETAIIAVGSYEDGENPVFKEMFTDRLKKIESITTMDNRRLTVDLMDMSRYTYSEDKAIRYVNETLSCEWTMVVTDADFALVEESYEPS